MADEEQWSVEVLNDVVEAELQALPDGMQARFSRVSELILAVGLPKMTAPHVKHLDGKLWEIRLKGKAGIARAIYVTATGKRVVVVRVFVKKTEKTPKGELELAKTRAAEVV